MTNHSPPDQPASHISPLTTLSPLDGRYGDKTTPLRELWSEYALIRCRMLVEIRWLQHLAAQPDIPEVGPFSTETQQVLESILTQFSHPDAERIKALEQTTHHDVKAVEYFLREQFSHDPVLSRSSEFIHFACTSDDINNLCYALLLQQTRHDILLPALESLHDLMVQKATEYAEVPMLSRTHGQTASPTTVGKEWVNIAARLRRQIQSLASLAIFGKCNGAVGNYNAHLAAYPHVDWLYVTEHFVQSLGLSFNAYTTQIEPHDTIAEWCHNLFRIHTILLDFTRDMWGYISLGYYKQWTKDGEVGSSTMPHKVNPIDFENAEGNLGLANTLLHHFADKLPISRWQRDLSDSTVLRNLGVALGYGLLAYQSLQRGIQKLELHRERLEEDLSQAWEVLAEPIQTAMRRYGIPHAYEYLKQQTRGKPITPDTIRTLVDNLPLPPEAKADLQSLTPASYTGWAAHLTKRYTSEKCERT